MSKKQRITELEGQVADLNLELVAERERRSTAERLVEVYAQSHEDMLDDGPFDSPVAKVKVYKANDGWRWRAVAGNNKTLADSGEAYINQKDCVSVVRRMFGDRLVEVVDK